MKVKGKKVKVKSKAYIVGLLLFTFALLASSCATRATRVPVPDAVLQEATLPQLMALLQERAGNVQTLKGLFRAQIQGPGIPGTQHLEGAVVYHRPDALRLRGFNRLGMRLFELGIGEDRYTLRLVNGKIMTGAMAELNRVETIARPFRLSVLAMTGIIGTPPVGTQERAVLKEEGDRYRVDVFAPAAMYGSDVPYRQIWFDRRSLQVVREDRLTPAGDLDSSVSFEDFRSVDLFPDGGIVQAGGSAGDVLKPFIIRGQDGQGQSSIQLIFREIVPNMPVKAEELQVTGAADRDNGKMG